MGPERRLVFAGIATGSLPAGTGLCMTHSVFLDVVGAVLLIFSLVVFASLLWGRPITSLQADVREGTEEGLPWHAPLDYQVDQLRQIIPHFNGEAFDERGLQLMIPKARRARIRQFHEPFQNFQWREGAEFLVSTGELEVISQFTWRATGKKPPSFWVRWRHGKTTEA